MSGLVGVVDVVLEDIKLQIAAQRQQNDELTQRQRYALDPFALLDDGHVRILDEHGGVSVFHPYQHQRDTAEAWIDLDHLRTTGKLRFRNVHIEKSRQMGETWILAYLCWWALAFHNVQGLMMHTDWGRVDDGGEKNTPESFFGKLRFLNRYVDAQSAGIDRPRLSFKTPQAPGGAAVRVDGRPDSYIAGSGQDRNPARGSRLRFAIVDEAAHVPYSESVHQSIDDACPSGVVYNSTPMGPVNAFARIRRTRPEGWTFLRFHWSQHPAYGEGQHIAGEDDSCQRCRETRLGIRPPAGGHRYPGRLTSPWYESRVSSKTDDAVATELDIDYVGSLTARVWPEWQPELHVWRGKGRLFDPNLPVELGWDFGISDPTSVVICQDAIDAYRVVGEFETTDATPDQISDAVIETLRTLGIAHPLTREWTRQILCITDVSGKARLANTGTSLWSDYATHGWSMTGQWSLVKPGVDAVARLLRGIPKRLLVDPETCPGFIEHVAAHRWPTDVNQNRRPGATKPQHDEHSHMSAAFRYLITHKFPPPEDDQALPPPAPDPFAPGPTLTPGMSF